MRDQVEQLRKRGIKADCLVSGLSDREREAVVNNCLYGGTKLLYVSPERLQQRAFITQILLMQVSLIAIDEAHCISQWGFDFRPSYLQLSQLRSLFPTVPIIALTASATPRVQNDIRTLLNFNTGYQTFTASFSRPNLAYMAL